MGSDMSKPRKVNNKNMQGFYTANQLNNQQTLMRPNNPTNKHLLCKEIDLPCPTLPQSQNCPQQCPEQAMYNNHHRHLQLQQQIPVPMHIPQQQIQQPICPSQVQQQQQQHQHQQPMSPQYSSNPRENFYDKYISCRDDYREGVYQDSENLQPQAANLIGQYQGTNSRSRFYYNDEQVPISNQSRSERERPERYRTRRSSSRRDDDDYIERYEIPKSQSRSHYKPSYQYCDDLENNIKISSRYRSKSSDKYLESKDYIDFDGSAFNMRCDKISDVNSYGKSKLESRSVYFIQDGQGDTYECSEIGGSRDAYKALYDPRSNLQHKRSSTHHLSGQSNVDVSDPYGFKKRNENLLTKSGICGDGQSQVSEPIVNVVNQSSDIVYVPMVKTEFIKRESQKIENIGQSAYQSQVIKQQEQQQKALKSNVARLNSLSKSYVSLQNIESSLKDELDTHLRNSPGHYKNNERSASRESNTHKPILKKSSTSNNETLDSDTTSSSASLKIESKKNLRDKLNAEFQQTRNRRNHFNNVNYSSQISFNTEILSTEPNLKVAKH